jgi:uncharacterized protein
MLCCIYRSSKKEGLYVYVLEDAGLDHLPDPVMKQLGEPTLALTVDLSKRTSLGQENIAEVRSNLESQGFHIQMPKDIEHLVTQAADESRQPPQ